MPTVAEVLADLRDAGVIPGWRNEMYPVTDRWHDEPCMLVERAASVLFGIKASHSGRTTLHLKSRKAMYKSYIGQFAQRGSLLQLASGLQSTHEAVDNCF